MEDMEAISRLLDQFRQGLITKSELIDSIIMMGDSDLQYCLASFANYMANMEQAGMLKLQ